MDLESAERARRALESTQDMIAGVIGIKRKLDDAHGAGIIEPQVYQAILKPLQTMNTTLRSFEISMESVYKGYGGYFYSPGEGIKGKIRYGF